MTLEKNLIIEKVIGFFIDMGIDGEISENITIKEMEIDSTELADFLAFLKKSFGVDLKNSDVENESIKNVSDKVLEKIDV